MKYIYCCAFVFAEGNTNFKIMDITKLTDTHIEQLAATWAIRVNRPNLYYTRFLNEVKRGERAVDLLPYFIIKHLLELGYSV